MDVLKKNIAHYMNTPWRIAVAGTQLTREQRLEVVAVFMRLFGIDAYEALCVTDDNGDLSEEMGDRDGVLYENTKKLFGLAQDHTTNKGPIAQQRTPGLPRVAPSMPSHQVAIHTWRSEIVDPLNHGQSRAALSKMGVYQTTSPTPYMWSILSRTFMVLAENVSPRDFDGTESSSVLECAKGALRSVTSWYSKIHNGGDHGGTSTYSKKRKASAVVDTPEAPDPTDAPLREISVSHRSDRCASCYGMCIVDGITSDMVCTRCAHTEFMQNAAEVVYGTDGNGVPFKDKNCYSSERRRKKSKNNYDPIRYFEKQLLALMVDMTPASYNPRVLEDVRAECTRSGARVEDIDWWTCRCILQGLGYTGEYKNVHKILYDLNGKKPPQMTHELAQRATEVFIQFFAVFNVIRGERMSINHRFFMYNILRGLDHPEFGDHFERIKTRKSVVENVKIFERIASMLGFPFDKSLYTTSLAGKQYS